MEHSRGSQPLWLLTGPTASGKSSVALSVIEAVNMPTLALTTSEVRASADLTNITLTNRLTNPRKTEAGLADNHHELSGIEIVSVDSMMLYRGMDIGTDKPSISVRQRVPHHLIDILDPWESYSLGRYVKIADTAVKDIRARGKIPLLVGGTALYIKGLIHGVFEGPSADWQLRRKLKDVAARKGVSYLHSKLAKVDAVSAARVHPNDLFRIVRALEVYEKTGIPISQLQQQFTDNSQRYHCTMVGLRMERDQLYDRINNRVERMFENGLLHEVESLTNHPGGLGRAPRQALGYKEVISYLQGERNLHKTKELIKRNTRRFAKRQLTWFRSFNAIDWIDVEQGQSARHVAQRALQHFITDSKNFLDKRRSAI